MIPHQWISEYVREGSLHSNSVQFDKTKFVLAITHLEKVYYYHATSEYSRLIVKEMKDIIKAEHEKATIDIQ